MNKDDIKALIEAGLPGAQVTVIGDDGQHFQAEVVYDGFAGKKLIDQHRMVNETVREHIERGELHALQLRTRAA